MPPIRSSIVSRALTAAIVVAVVHTGGLTAGTTAGQQGPGIHDGWMPDVADRVAELRERSERAAAEARVRRVADKRSGQWWRMVAAVPAEGRVR